MVLVIGAKGKLFMKRKKVKYTNEPIEEIQIVEDFLPKPGDLILKDESIKVTLALSKSSIDFFKQQAKQHHSKYQKMIRALLEQYAAYYKQNKSA